MPLASARNGVKLPVVFTLEVGGLSEPLRVVRYTGYESINDAFAFDLYVVSDNAELVFADVVGKDAHLLMGDQAERRRLLHGIIRRFELAYHTAHRTTYRASMVPHAFKMRLRENNRIFQHMTAPDIISQVIGDASVEAHTMALSESYAEREYCVQYRESDWAFICRLMEEEGMFFFFEHGQSEAKLVIADAASAYNDIPGNAEVLYRPNAGALSLHEAVTRLHYGEEVRPGKITRRDYNFETPALSLEASAAADIHDDLELYHFPGNYRDDGTGAALASRALEAQQANRKSGDGDSSVMRLAPGHTFQLGGGESDDLRDDLNQKYLITRVEHQGTDPSMETAGQTVNPYSNRFWIVPAEVPYRPIARTPRPRIFGVQTAKVVGPGGEEIHTDAHGRIKVQFHWDRQGANDENSSCWVRVKQPWAGPGWGHLFIPRIGQEVVVDFIEGDPDRPLVTGAVYHAANVPPYPLPGEKTKSTIKTESSVGGGGYNELRFEDLKGNEEIYLQGEKDWNILIKNDKGETIGHDETLDVGNDQTIHIVQNRRKTVDNDQEESIGGNKSISVGKDHGEHIHQNESISIDGNASLMIGGSRNVTVNMAHNETVLLAQTSNVGLAWAKTVGAAMALTVGASKTETVGGTSNENVGGERATNIGKSYSLNVAKDQSLVVGKSVSMKIGKDRSEEIGDNLSLTVGKKIKIQCGKALITVEQNGNISIEGKDAIVTGTGNIKVKGKKLKIESDSAIDMKASGNVKIKGSKIDLN